MFSPGPKRPEPSDGDWFLPKYLTRRAQNNPHAASQTSLKSLKSMGFVLVSDSTGPFYRMVPPPGYTKQEERVNDTVSWFKIFDEKGQKVAKQFEKTASYDRDAFIIFL